MLSCRRSNACPLSIHDYGAQRSETFRIAKVSVDGESETEEGQCHFFWLDCALTAYGLASWEY